MKKRYSLIFQLTIIALIYLLAYFVVYILFNSEILTFSIVNILIADIIATAIVFMFSVILNNSSVYDPYWSVIPPIIVLYLINQFPEGNSFRQIIIFVLVAFWSIRLTVNWGRGWNGFKHQDWRYINIAEKTKIFYWPVSFLGIHLMPTLFVFAGCLPLWYSLSSTEPFNFYDGFAVLFTFVAILIEWIADEQLKQFKKKDKINGFIQSGLWSVSRHPNYLGEICFWISLFLFVVSTSKFNNLTGYWTVGGLISMIILFKFISIPMMEKRNKIRKPGYQNYIDKVPALFPRIFF